MAGELHLAAQLARGEVDEGGHVHPEQLGVDGSRIQGGEPQDPGRDRPGGVARPAL